MVAEIGKNGPGAQCARAVLVIAERSAPPAD
jgi:hypothetical protein